MRFMNGRPLVFTIVAGVSTPGAVAYLKTSSALYWDVLADWTGSIAGTFKVEAGGDFDGPNQIATRPGKWVDVTKPIANPAGAVGSTEISGVFWTAAWMRISLNGISGDGILTLVEATKG